MTLPAARLRTIEIPRLMRLVRGPEAVMAALADLVGTGHRLLIVHSGPRSVTGYGAIVGAHALAHGYEVGTCIVASNDEASVAAVADAIDTFVPDFVIAVGGGKVVDTAKLAAARRGSQVVTIPTQLASDAICSPVAIVLDASGRRESVGARMPVAIIVDMAVAESAPARTWLAGLGDLVSNLSAVKDWREARDARDEEFDDFACLTSEAAALLVLGDDPDIASSEFREKLIRGLILSGIAMEMAGSSRPSSGSEHLISHALDRILDRPSPHGLQVALATIAAGILRGEDVHRQVAWFRAAGLPVVPADLGIALDDFIAAVRLGPSTRPGRTTILDDIGEDDLAHLRDVLEHDLA